MLRKTSFKKVKTHELVVTIDVAVCKYWALMFLLLSVSLTERGFFGFVLFIFKGKKSQRTCLENYSLKSDIVKLVVTGLGW